MPRTAFILLVLFLLPGGAWAQSSSTGNSGTEIPDQTTVPKHGHFIRGAFNYGSVLATNSFVEGENLSGEPIDTFKGVRLEFGWETTGTMVWHHVYNFPSYGLGINGVDYFNDEELGKPTSIYGFYNWPLKRWGNKTLYWDLGFGLTDNWVGFDEVSNPYNVAIGAGRSVYIDLGLIYELPLGKRWWLQGGINGTHYSNGGSQQPNWGINQIGAIAYLKYGLNDRIIPDERRVIAPLKPYWEVSTTLSYGIRNIAMDLRNDPEYESYLTKDYPIFDAMMTWTRVFTHKSAYDFGLDVNYNGSVEDMMTINSLENGGEPVSAGFWDYMSLGVFAGYEQVVHRARMLVQFGYEVFRKDVPGQLPAFYQRLGLKYFVWNDLFAGLNVRFHDFSQADNLEFNIGYKVN